MGGGIHGGFKNTTGAKAIHNRKIFNMIYFEGSVKVAGVEKDVSR